LLGTLSCAFSQSGLVIRVVEGDNAINSIRLRRGHDPVVQVVSDFGEPLRGVTVSFLLPASGAGGTFPTGLSLTIQTDARGMAAARGLVPNRIEGPFRIRVTASSKGESGSVNINQTNAEPAPKSSRGKWIAIAIAVGGAAVGGAALAARGGGSSSPAGGTTGGTTTPGGTIVPGTPSLGPPR
jgi:hypothetical protein